MLDVWPILYIALIVILVFAGIKLFESIIRAVLFALIVGVVFFSIAYIDLVRKINEFKPSSILIGYENSKFLGGFIVKVKNNKKIVKLLTNDELEKINKDYESYFKNNNISLALIYNRDGIEDISKETTLNLKTSSGEIIEVKLSKEDIIEILYSESPLDILKEKIEEEYNETIELANYTDLEIKETLFLKLNKGFINEEEILQKIITLSKEDKIKVYPEFWWIKVMKYIPLTPVVGFYNKIIKFVKDTIVEQK